MISPWTEVPQAPGADVLFERVGMFHSYLGRDFQILEDSLTNGENSLVYSSLPVCKYLMLCFEAQTSTNHAIAISQSHQD